MTNREMFVNTDLGPIRLRAEGEALAGLWFADHRHAPPPLGSIDGSPLLREAAAQVTAFFAGDLVTFDLPLVARGTPFQERVWRELTRIPYGETVTYGELARRVGRPTASRAVGAANGRNPLSIVVPCHRVVGASGDLVGYGGGLPQKRWLLAHEEAHARRTERRRPRFAANS